MLTTKEDSEKLELLIGNAIEEKWNKSSSPIMDKLKCKIAKVTFHLHLIVH